MNLVLFFSYGASLQYWQETGLFEREILLYKKLEDKGVHVTFLTYGDENDFKLLNRLGGIQVLPAYSGTHRPKNKIVALLHSLFLPWIFRKNLAKADLYKTNQMSGSWVALIAKLIHRKKLVLRCGYELYRFVCQQRVSALKRCAVYLLEMVAYRLADTIFLTAEDEKIYITKTFSISEQPVHIIPNFIDLNIFKKKEVKKNNKLLFIGRLNYQKNLELLFQAISNTDIELDIIGHGDKRIYDKTLKDLNVKVNFYTNITNKYLVDYYNKCSIFILCSRFEGNPKTLLEAMSCECAIICTNVDGIKENVNSNNAIIVENDPKELQEAIFKLLKNPSIGQLLGQRARENIVAYHNIDLIVKKFVKLYLKLTNE